MTILYAQPYDITATGFYFESANDYAQKARNAVNHFGQHVEEFEIQCISGEALDVALFAALGVHQGLIASYFFAVSQWEGYEKIRVIIAVVEGGYAFDLTQSEPDDIDVDIYQCDSLRDLAIKFVEDGLFGNIPERLQFYLDYNAIARDLSADYSETTINGTRYAYRLP